MERQRYRTAGVQLHVFQELPSGGYNTGDVRSETQKPTSETFEG